MKVLLLSDISSTHTFNWAKYLTESKCEIYLFSLNSLDEKTTNAYKELRINIYSLSLNNKRKGVLNKLLYLKGLNKLRAVIKEIQPDVIHAHYATSYGLFGVLSAREIPLVISVWGSDIMSFPNKSWIHSSILSFILRQATVVCCTSNELKRLAKGYCQGNIHVIPFGIDISKFYNKKTTSKKSVTIGSIKHLEPIYNTELLIKVFSELIKIKGCENINLQLVGSGSQEHKLKGLVSKMNLSDKINFVGWVPQKEVPYYHNVIDIFVNISVNESFGVSVLEASACETPVIVSWVGGLKEVVLNGDTGYLVNLENVSDIIEKIKLLVLNETKRKEMGKKGRQFVIDNYTWQNSTKLMLNLYKSLID